MGQKPSSSECSLPFTSMSFAGNRIFMLNASHEKPTCTSFTRRRKYNFFSNEDAARKTRKLETRNLGRHPDRSHPNRPSHTDVLSTRTFVFSLCCFPFVSWIFLLFGIERTVRSLSWRWGGASERFVRLLGEASEQASDRPGFLMKEVEQKVVLEDRNKEYNSQCQKRARQHAERKRAN